MVLATLGPLWSAIYVRRVIIGVEGFVRSCYILEDLNDATIDNKSLSIRSWGASCGLWNASRFRNAKRELRYLRHVIDSEFVMIFVAAVISIMTFSFLQEEHGSTIIRDTHTNRDLACCPFVQQLANPTTTQHKRAQTKQSQTKNIHTRRDQHETPCIGVSKHIRQLLSLREFRRPTFKYLGSKWVGRRSHTELCVRKIGS